MGDMFGDSLGHLKFRQMHGERTLPSHHSSFRETAGRCDILVLPPCLDQSANAHAI